MKYALLALLIAMVAFSSDASGSSRSNAETYAQNFLTNIFVKSGDVWYASRSSGLVTISPAGGSVLQGDILVEFKELSFAYQSLSVSETEKLNGMTDRVMISGMWKHYRNWKKGKWGEWMGGAKAHTSSAILGKIAAPIMADWRMTFTRKNGEWSFSQYGGFSTNRQQTLQLIDRVVYGKIPEAPMESEKPPAPVPSVAVLTNQHPAPAPPKSRPKLTVKLKGVIEEEGKMTVQTDKGEFYEGKETAFGKVLSVSREKVETDEQTIIIMDR